MTELERLLAEQACARLVVDFAQYLDDSDYDALDELLAEDCEYARPFDPAHPYYGKDKVAAIFRGRRPMLTRHLMTNIRIDVLSETEARGSSYLTMLSSPHTETPPYEAGGIFVGAFNDVFVREGGKWKIKTRKGSLALYQGGPLPVLPTPSDEARGVKR